MILKLAIAGTALLSLTAHANSIYEFDKEEVKENIQFEFSDNSSSPESKNRGAPKHIDYREPKLYNYHFLANTAWEMGFTTLPGQKEPRHTSINFRTRANSACIHLGHAKAVAGIAIPVLNATEERGVILVDGGSSDGFVRLREYSANRFGSRILVRPTRFKMISCSNY